MISKRLGEQGMKIGYQFLFFFLCRLIQIYQKRLNNVSLTTHTKLDYALRYKLANRNHTCMKRLDRLDRHPW